MQAGNLCCCLWIISGGVTAAYLLQQSQTAPVTPGDGALVGLLAGLAGAFVYVVIAVPTAIVIAPIQRELMARLMDRLGDVPPQFRAYANQSGATSVAFMIIDFVMRLFLGALFSTLGGLLGAAIVAKKTPPAQPGVADGPMPGI